MTNNIYLKAVYIFVCACNYVITMVIPLRLKYLQVLELRTRKTPKCINGYNKFNDAQLFYHIAESRAGPSYIGNVVSQILLCKQIRPDFNEEELCSIRKDSKEIGQLIAELQEFMPQSEADTGTIPPVPSFIFRPKLFPM